MTLLRGVFSLVLLLPAGMAASAQQMAKPVLSAVPDPAPPASAPSAIASEPVSVTPSYVIGADDSLKVDVWTDKPEPNMSASGIPVRPDGNITLPLIGDVQAAGSTPEQLSVLISDRLKKLVNDPTVTVTVQGVNSKRIFLIGEVNHVGPLSITPGMTVLQAIASAGGLTAYAKKTIHIQRVEQGKQRIIQFDYKKALKKGDMQGVTLEPGDTLVVN